MKGKRKGRKGKTAVTTADDSKRRKICDLLDRNLDKLVFGAPFERPWSNDSKLTVVDKVEPQLVE